MANSSLDVWEKSEFAKETSPKADGWNSDGTGNSALERHEKSPGFDKQIIKSPSMTPPHSGHQN